jgi:hypothetical protein
LQASVPPTLAQDLGGEPSRREGFVARMEAGMARRRAARPEPAIIPLGTMAIVK